LTNEYTEQLPRDDAHKKLSSSVQIIAGALMSQAV
jgi:hypothetical protein